VAIAGRVAALDSCERESHRKADHAGMLSDAQAQAVLDHWRTSSVPHQRGHLTAHRVSDSCRCAVVAHGCLPRRRLDPSPDVPCRVALAFDEAVTVVRRRR
jgi:hypothetical protein